MSMLVDDYDDDDYDNDDYYEEDVSEFDLKEYNSINREQLEKIIDTIPDRYIPEITNFINLLKYKIIVQQNNSRQSYCEPDDYEDDDMETTETESSTSIEMVHVEGGPFNKKVLVLDGSGNHNLVINNVDSFEMSTTQVTQKLYESVMGTNPSNGEKGDDYPVTDVTWYDAVKFCNKLSEKEGLTPCYSGSDDSIKCDFKANGYRLPTAAEWLYASHGGINNDKYKYSGSDDINDVAWYEDNSDDELHEVATLNPNSLGIYDMSGNVVEWGWDIGNDVNRRKRYVFGGCHNSPDDGCTVDSVFQSNPNGTSDNFGIRLVRSK